MIDAARKVIAAYHDAPVGKCRHCGFDVDDSLHTDRGIHGTPGLTETIEELEGILAIIDRITAARRAGVPFEG